MPEEANHIPRTEALENQPRHLVDFLVIEWTWAKNESYQNWYPVNKICGINREETR